MMVTFNHEEVLTMAEMARDALLERVRRSWSELERTLGTLGDGERAPALEGGWSANDHMAHVAAWETYLVALLEGRDPYAAIGVPGLDAPVDTDARNEIVARRHAGLPPEEVRRLSAEAHARVMAALEALTDADLARPYSSYLPGVDHPDRDRPIAEWVLGNTADHYDEHRAWLQPSLSPSGGGG